MATERQLLVMLMTTLMLGAGLAGCLGGEDGESPDCYTNPDPDGSDTTATLDSDGDGTIDALDQCDFTPGPIDSPAGLGCPVPVYDTDADGIEDGDDRYQPRRKCN